MPWRRVPASGGAAGCSATRPVGVRDHIAAVLAGSDRCQPMSGPDADARWTEEMVASCTDWACVRAACSWSHTSFRAVRPVAGGPPGLIDALRSALGPKARS